MGYPATHVGRGALAGVGGARRRVDRQAVPRDGPAVRRYGVRTKPNTIRRVLGAAPPRRRRGCQLGPDPRSPGGATAWRRTVSDYGVAELRLRQERRLRVRGTGVRGEPRSHPATGFACVGPDRGWRRRDGARCGQFTSPRGAGGPDRGAGRRSRSGGLGGPPYVRLRPGLELRRDRGVPLRRARVRGALCRGPATSTWWTGCAPTTCCSGSGSTCWRRCGVRSASASPASTSTAGPISRTTPAREGGSTTRSSACFSPGGSREPARPRGTVLHRRAGLALVRCGGAECPAGTAGRDDERVRPIPGPGS